MTTLTPEIKNKAIELCIADGKDPNKFDNAGQQYQHYYSRAIKVLEKERASNQQADQKLIKELTQAVEKARQYLESKDQWSKYDAELDDYFESVLQAANTRLKEGRNECN